MTETHPAPEENPFLDDRERRLHPSVRIVWRLRTAIGLLPPLIVVGALATALTPAARWPLAAVTLLGYVAMVVWHPQARWRRWSWRMTSLALELRHGVLVHRREAVPYFRVQQIDITTGPLDRLLGLASLEVASASSTGTAVLPGLAADEAPEVRMQLLARSAAALAAHPDEARDAV